jgi:hypothetical protein
MKQISIPTLLLSLALLFALPFAYLKGHQDGIRDAAPPSYTTWITPVFKGHSAEQVASLKALLTPKKGYVADRIAGSGWITWANSQLINMPEPKSENEAFMILGEQVSSEAKNHFSWTKSSGFIVRESFHWKDIKLFVIQVGLSISYSLIILFAAPLWRLTPFRKTYGMPRISPAIAAMAGLLFLCMCGSVLDAVPNFLT